MNRNNQYDNFKSVNNLSSGGKITTNEIKTKKLKKNIIINTETLVIKKNLNDLVESKFPLTGSGTSVNPLKFESKFDVVEQLFVFVSMANHGIGVKRIVWFTKPVNTLKGVRIRYQLSEDSSGADEGSFRFYAITDNFERIPSVASDPVEYTGDEIVFGEYLIIFNEPLSPISNISIELDTTTSDLNGYADIDGIIDF